MLGSSFMKWRTKALAGLCAALAIAGCSDDDNERSGRSGALWEEYCQAEATRQAQCGGSYDLQSCLDDRACIDGVYRPDVIEPLTRCLRERACGQGDDACFSQAAALHESEPPVAAYRAACIQRRTECEPSGQVFSDDLCFNTGLAQPVVQEELARCLSRPCDQNEDCLNGVLEARGC
jgi:hypothetical protein